jgi:rhamnose transport system permease protein
VLLIGGLNNLLTLNDGSNEIQRIVSGLLLVASVLTPRLLAVLSERRERRSAAPPPAVPAPGPAS